MYQMFHQMFQMFHQMFQMFHQMFQMFQMFHQMFHQMVLGSVPMMKPIPMIVVHDESLQMVHIIVSILFRIFCKLIVILFIKRTFNKLGTGQSCVECSVCECPVDCWIPEDGGWERNYNCENCY